MIRTLSAERIRYLKRKRWSKIFTRLVQLLIVIALIVAWEVLANIGVIDSFIASKPSQIVETFVDMISNDLLMHIGITCEETILGFLIGTILGTAVASLLWWFPFLSKVFSPFLVVLNSLPKVALGPIIIVWVGAGMPAIITMALAISLIVTILEMLNGFNTTDSNKIKMAQTFGANRLQIFNKIVFPSNIPVLFNAMKVNIGLSMVGVITGEFLVSKGGLGYLIVYGGQVFKLNLVMTSVIILGIVATLMYQYVILVEKIVNSRGKWK